MSCETYREALIEAAACGLEPQGDLPAHLEACGPCCTLFAEERSLFASIDSGLQAAANTEVPSSLLPRVRASLDEAVASHRSWRLNWFALAGATVAVAVFFTTSVFHQTDSRRQTRGAIANKSPIPRAIEPPQDAVSSTQSKPADVGAPQALSAVKHVEPQEVLASRNPRLEVLVPRDQEFLVASYAQQWSARQRAPLLAQDADQTTVTPLEVAPIQIVELDVKLLTEDGSR